MKKLLLLALTVTAATSLTGCFSSNSLGNEYAEELTKTLQNAGVGPEYSTMAEYVTGYAGYTNATEMAYSCYTVDHVVVPTLTTTFGNALADADITSKQFYAITDALDEVLLGDSAVTIELLFIDTLFDAKLSSDQLINTIYNTFQGLDDVVLDSINASTEKSNYSTEHASFVTYVETYLKDESVAALFDLTEEQRNDDLLIGQVTFGDALDYVYALETTYETLFAQFESADGDISGLFTQSNITAIVEANYLAFKDSFGATTEKNYQDAAAIMLKVNAELDSSFDASLFDADELGTGVYLAKEAVLTVFENLAETDNQTVVSDFVFALVGLNDADTYMLYNFSVILADSLLDIKEDLTADQFAMLGIDETVLNTLSNGGFVYTDLSEAQEEALGEFMESLQALSELFF